MIETSTKSNNPYQAPTSNLADESDDLPDWNRTVIHCAERRDRTLFCASVSALYLSVFWTMILDIILFGWTASLFGNMLFPTAIAYVVALVFSYPVCKLTVYFQRKGKTVSKFITKQRNEIGKWYSKPIFTTLLVAIVSLFFLFALLFVDEYSRLLFDLDPSQLARRCSALLTLPILMPLTYILVKASQRKARNLLEKMPESS